MASHPDHSQRRLTKGVSSYGPEKTIMTNTFRLAVILFLLRFHPSLGAATLTQETKTAWGAYLQAANAAYIRAGFREPCRQEMSQTFKEQMLYRLSADFDDETRQRAIDQSLREFPTMEPESKGSTRNRKPCLPI